MGRARPGVSIHLDQSVQAAKLLQLQQGCGNTAGGCEGPKVPGQGQQILPVGLRCVEAVLDRRSIAGAQRSVELEKKDLGLPRRVLVGQVPEVDQVLGDIGQRLLLHHLAEVAGGRGINRLGWARVGRFYGVSRVSDASPATSGSTRDVKG